MLAISTVLVQMAVANLDSSFVSMRSVDVTALKTSVFQRVTLSRQISAASLASVSLNAQKVVRHEVPTKRSVLAEGKVKVWVPTTVSMLQCKEVHLL